MKQMKKKKEKENAMTLGNLPPFYRERKWESKQASKKKGIRGKIKKRRRVCMIAPPNERKSLNQDEDNTLPTPPDSRAWLPLPSCDIQAWFSSRLWFGGVTFQDGLDGGMEILVLGAAMTTVLFDAGGPPRDRGFC